MRIANSGRVGSGFKEYHVLPHFKRGIAILFIATLTILLQSAFFSNWFSVWALPQYTSMDGQSDYMIWFHNEGYPVWTDGGSFIVGDSNGSLERTSPRSFMCFGGTAYAMHVRTGLFELLEMTPTLRELILQRASSTEIKRAAVSQMLSIRDDGLRKATQGITSIPEVLRVAMSSSGEEMS